MASGRQSAKSRSFSIYLLKQGFDEGNALKEDHALDDTVDAAHLPDGAALFVLDNSPKATWWRTYFGIKKQLKQVTKGALVFLPVGKRCFALSFGHVYHNLREESYEYDFGIRVTLNSLDPKKLRSTDILEPGAARRRRTQIPTESDLTYFDFDRDSNILKSLTGRVRDEYAPLFKHATGASNLRISSAVSPKELESLCTELLHLYESTQYKETFPDIQNITPVRDPTTISELNSKLVVALRARNEDLFLAIPDVVNYSDNVCARFKGEGGSLIYDDVFLERYYEYLGSSDVALDSIGMADLKRHQLVLTDEDGSPRQSYSIIKCLVFDTKLDSSGETFHLSEGDWYQANDAYVERLMEYLDSRCVDLPLPDFNHDGEGPYNKAVAAGDSSYLCLDTTNIAPLGQSQVEPCDLYSIESNLAVFHHIKISTFSAQLSHLFNQGANAIQLLKLEPQSAARLSKLIDGAAKKESDDFKKPLSEGRFRVVYGIVTHKNKSLKSGNLPLFSRISLKRVMTDLQLMSVEACYGFIANVKPKKAGKKKQRKANTKATA